ncbi:hypothetical protein EMIHUDRAFT_194585 [Emiliania huxleyi CCMP1516]|uniref:F-box domain-containing protein n=2 Tax=Emiliania huxleyi TaxID=2903 RepID=A0A0D3L1S6_EMIH1|nr:hypothetical protein EMIHUDRAFT_194585 [Emiliania huxleyi CCMP1516]EOD41961.1 hypothetical protein EMIHUDRAFT_194585 [Emiliania huxleyi CCMP1516]|eukprot:XP_005794390.1 hypothetical protein EMIHUDRAFT_194585 [Emiliania huxleyi CCMP1516]
MCDLIEPSTTMDDLPEECLVHIACQLRSVRDLGAAAQASKLFRDVFYSDFVWRALCVAGKHGASLDFSENVLGSFSHPDAKPTARGAAAGVERQSSASGQPWREVYRTTRQECTQASLLGTAMQRLGLRRATLPAYSAIVSEPFKYAGDQDRGFSAPGRRGREACRADTEQQLLHGFGVRRLAHPSPPLLLPRTEAGPLSRLAIVDSASLCLFSHRLTSGVVVNIGFGEAFLAHIGGASMLAGTSTFATHWAVRTPEAVARRYGRRDSGGQGDGDDFKQSSEEEEETEEETEPREGPRTRSQSQGGAPSQGGAAGTSGIDYSRWDRLQCSDDDDD